MPTKRRLILGVLAVLLLVFLYRVFAVYTVRSGECRPRPAGPGLRLLTRDEHGMLVSFPERTGFPPQRRPLVVMTYNIAGHDELVDGDHVRHIAEAIQRLHPDVVALQEVHRKTWQSRFRDQLAELESRTGLHGYFAPSYGRWGGGYGNAILTRGQVVQVQVQVHPLPCLGEPRALLESTIRIDRATITFYATHLTAWGRLNSKIRAEQLQCLGREFRTSRHPYFSPAISTRVRTRRRWRRSAARTSRSSLRRRSDRRFRTGTSRSITSSPTTAGRSAPRAPGRSKPRTTCL